MTCPVCGATVSSNGEAKIKCPYCAAEIVTGEPEKKVVAPPLTPKPQRTARKKNEGVNVFEENINGVLEITWNINPFMATSGSGLLVDERGYAITNAHVVTNDEGIPCREMNVKIAGEDIKAKVIRLGDKQAGGGPGVDLALIKLNRVPRKAKVMTFVDFDDVRIGEQVFVIGNSLGDGTCITSGIVSDKRRKIGGHTVLMTDCAINGGNSGGPIFNSEGRVIGVICSSRIQADGSATEGMNYAIPADIVEDFMSGYHIAVKVDPADPHVNFKVASNKGPICPKCKSTNTDVENGIAYCYDCEHEWGVN